MKRPLKQGDKYGKLTAISFERRDSKHQWWLFQCDCGNTKEIRKGDIFRKIGATISCGCYRTTLKRTHGHGHSRLNNIWSGILTRIRNSNATDFKYYGGKGITISENWLIFEGFLKDMEKSYKYHCKKHGEKNTTIDRIDSARGYSKDNCRWSTYRVQNNNKSNNVKYKGETATQASYRLTEGQNQWLVFGRLKNGWDIKRAFTEKKRS